jgi:hypothetical protein
MYDLTQQWTLMDGPFMYDFEWLSVDNDKDQMTDWCRDLFAKTYGSDPASFEIL